MDKMNNLDEKRVIKKIEKNIESSINSLKFNIILEKLYFKILNLITLKFTKLPDEVYTFFKKEFDLLVLENEKSLELVKNIDLLYEVVRQRGIYDILTVKYYNIMVNYCGDSTKITEERAKKCIEFLNTVSLYCKGISYNSNKEFSDTMENINEMNKHSKVLEKLKNRIS